MQHQAACDVQLDRDRQDGVAEPGMLGGLRDGEYLLRKAARAHRRADLAALDQVLPLHEEEARSRCEAAPPEAVGAFDEWADLRHGGRACQDAVQADPVVPSLHGVDQGSGKCSIASPRKSGYAAGRTPRRQTASASPAPGADTP